MLAAGLGWSIARKDYYINSARQAPYVYCCSRGVSECGHVFSGSTVAPTFQQDFAANESHITDYGESRHCRREPCGILSRRYYKSVASLAA